MSTSATALDREVTDARPTTEEVEAFVASAMRSQWRSDAIALVSVPAPAVAPEALLRLLPAQPASLWRPPAGSAFAAVGVTAGIEVAGERRIDDLRERAAELFARVEVCAMKWPGAAPQPVPRLFGGLAFRPGGATDIPWRDHGDGSFVMPRWCYERREDGTAWLTLAVADPGNGAPEAVGRRVSEMLESLEGDRGPGESRSTATDVHQQAVDVWTDEVEAIRAAIRSGEFEKIVLARRADIDLSAPMDATGVLERLSSRYPDCFRFGFRRGTSTFVGATPERLIEKSGPRISTEALAGSIAIGPDTGADELERQSRRLLDSAKDRAEHQLVVNAVAEALAPLCSELHAPDEPTIRTLRHMLHLRTPVTGALAGDTHVLDLVAALHPTPAVGGVPTAPAVDWVSRRECTERGWYAGPVGWFDADGDGEFAVALRAGVLRGRRAYVFAGAGIVTDSDAEAEYAETGLKQRAILGALGVAG